MNQILSTYKKSENSNTSKNSNIKKKKSIFFKIQFVVCIVIAVTITSYYAYSSYENNRKEAVSQKLANNFNITTLYNNNSNYSTEPTSSR